MNQAAERDESALIASELNQADAARKREHDCLQLSRTRVLQDMESATNPRYREQLQRSLDFLEEKLARAASAK